MSTFKAFQTGLAVGQQQRQQQAEADARSQAADAYGAGNHEGAVAALRRTGLMQDADAYERAGARQEEKDKTKAYGDAYKMGMTSPGYDGALGGPVGGARAVRDLAGGQGDLEMASAMDKFVTTADEQTRQAAGRKSLAAASLAFDLKGLPPEQREAARDAWVQTHGAATGITAQDLAGQPMDDASLDAVMNFGVDLNEKIKTAAAKTAAAAAAAKPIEVSKGASLAVPDGKGGFRNGFTAPDPDAGGLGGLPSGMTAGALERNAFDYNYGSGKLPSIGVGTAGAAAKEAITARAAEMARENGDDPGKLAAWRAEVKAKSASLDQQVKQRSAVRSFEDTFLSNIDVVLGLMPSAKNGNSPVVNRWINAGRKGVAGDAELGAFDTAIRTVANEYAKIAEGATGSAGSSVDSRREAGELLNANLSPAQIVAKIEVLRKDAHNRTEAMDKQIDTLTKRIGLRPDGGISGDGRTSWAMRADQIPEGVSPESWMAEHMAPSGAGAIPAPALAELRSDPSPAAQAEFDQIFGAGSAKRVLNGAH